MLIGSSTIIFDALHEKLRISTEFDPPAAPAYGALADCLRDKKLYDTANEKYQKAIEADPLYQDAYICWGQNLQIQGHYQEAIPKYMKFLELCPRSVEAYERWGECLTKLQQYSEAIDKFKIALNINPYSRRGFKGLIHACEDAKLYAEAIEYAERHVANQKIDDCSVLLSLGNCYLKLGRYENAFEQFTRLMKLQPTCMKHAKNKAKYINNWVTRNAPYYNILKACSIAAVQL